MKKLTPYNINVKESKQCFEWWKVWKVNLPDGGRAILRHRYVYSMIPFYKEEFIPLPFSLSLSPLFLYYPSYSSLYIYLFHLFLISRVKSLFIFFSLSSFLQVFFLIYLTLKKLSIFFSLEVTLFSFPFKSFVSVYRGFQIFSWVV